jgi:hypothetical protein
LKRSSAEPQESAASDAKIADGRAQCVGQRSERRSSFVGDAAASCKRVQPVLVLRDLTRGTAQCIVTLASGCAGLFEP